MVTEGTADIGLGPYVSDLKANKNPNLIVVGGCQRRLDSNRNFHSPIHQSERRQSLQRLVDFLDSKDAKAVYEEAGYSRISSAICFQSLHLHLYTQAAEARSKRTGGPETFSARSDRPRAHT